ncbi:MULTISPECIES: hypothetical protein [Arthrobacter]|uniref:Uncharacterized protein n=1 Tax=Arthrobacter psychrochitiniphilus TaxID=291045 RepID=A0A2V3DUZ1_9MICC|nr:MULTISPECIES: hypothetical protein [Arthrobacter]NYG15585.1 hypothetical protein [Arthrobacter psychrochitiniphilus]PXA66926.1 hypothetical protein CVS29_05075 [Arthrobacter psychrochitiniphilus]
MSVAVGSVLNLVQRQLDVPETQKFIGEQFFADETESVLAMAVDQPADHQEIRGIWPVRFARNF